MKVETDDKFETASRLLRFVPSLKKKTLEDLSGIRKHSLNDLVDKLTAKLSAPVDMKHRKIRTSANMLYSVYKAWQDQNPKTKPTDLLNRMVFIRVSGNVVLGCLSHAKWIYKYLEGETK